MWLPSANDRKGEPQRPKRKRRRQDPNVAAKHATSSDSEPGGGAADPPSHHNMEVEDDNDEGAGVTSDEKEDATIRANNAYPGALNTIGSVHQRNWMLTLDRRNSGFRKERSEPNAGRWIGAWEPFFVRGRDHEKSVVTGRDADAVMKDAGVERFVGRKMWRPILK